MIKSFEEEGKYIIVIVRKRYSISLTITPGEEKYAFTIKEYGSTIFEDHGDIRDDTYSKIQKDIRSYLYDAKIARFLNQELQREILSYHLSTFHSEQE